MFNLKKKIETKIEEVKTDIIDNADMMIIGVTIGVTLSYMIGYVVGKHSKDFSNVVNVTVIERERELINNIIVNK